MGFVDTDFWYNEIGVNVIHADTLTKYTDERWSKWQDKPIPIEVYEGWKKSGAFSTGCAIIVGKIWRGKYSGNYLACVDIDNEVGIKEFLSKFGKEYTLEKLSQKTIVEQHLDAKDKAHIYFIVEKPLSKKSGIGGPNYSEKQDIPTIEVKSQGKHGIMFCSPSIHKNGAPYQIIGTLTPTVLNEEQSEGLENSMDEIYKDFGIALPSDNKIPIQELFKSDFEIHEGNNRHLAIMRVMESLIQRLRGIYSIEEIIEIAQRWNQKHCKPPLNDLEFKRQWHSATPFIQKNDATNQCNISTGYENGKTEEKSTIIDIHNLLNSVKERWVEVFIDQFGKYYITIRVKDHVECIPLNSSRFKGTIRNEYFDKEKKILSEDRLEAILKQLESELMFSDDLKKIELNLRVAARKEEPNVFYYDLTNSQWEIVKISSERWEVIKDNNLPLFKRYEGNCSPQVMPSTSLQDNEKGFNQFFKLFNLQSESDKLLLKVYLISLFIPEIPKVILVVKGNGGGAKTTAFRMIKNIADPCNVDDFSFSKQINDIIQTLEHQHVVFFDNVSHISDDLSDLFCRAVTGAGFSKRALYTDDGDILYRLKRCIGFNGINLATTRADFLDRSLVIKFKRIEENARRKEEDIKKEFEILRPFVLGYIFDTLVKALKYKEEHKDEKILKNGFPRMADFAEWGEIISRCLGNDENEFIEAYNENKLDQNDEVIEASPVAESILLFMSEREQGFLWEGTPTKLHKVLTDIIDQIKPELRRSNLWPKGSNKLTSKINEVIPNLKDKGIDVITGEKNKQGDRVIRIEKIWKRSSNLTEGEREFNLDIHRIGYTDQIECDKCSLEGDIHLMKDHVCL